MEFTSGMATAIESGLDSVIIERQERVKWFEENYDEEYLNLAKKHLVDAKKALEWAKEYWLSESRKMFDKEIQ